MIDKRQDAKQRDQELLYFWALGDLHFRDHGQWRRMHTPRMDCLFEDLTALWKQEGTPAFCVSPGDQIECGAPRNYRFARQAIADYLGDLPFYPGLGNHEYYPEEDEQEDHTAEEYCAAWEKPVCYTWTAGKDEDIVCIMLDHFFGFLSGPDGTKQRATFCSSETLTFLDAALAQHAQRRAVIFTHCPLRNTVLDRDPVRHLDDDSMSPFFGVENSQEVRAVLARHPNAVLYISGHTHSGWGSPQLVFTERSGEHPLTHLNLMSPWYTGFNGPTVGMDTLEYRSDNPDMLASFAVHIYPDKALIRARDHRAGLWLQDWTVPLAY